VKSSLEKELSTQTEHQSLKLAQCPSCAQSAEDIEAEQLRLSEERSQQSQQFSSLQSELHSLNIRVDDINNKNEALLVILGRKDSENGLLKKELEGTEKALTESLTELEKLRAQVKETERKAGMILSIVSLSRSQHTSLHFTDILPSDRNEGHEHSRKRSRF
jgi:chromosome segregation ATPase